MFIVVVMGGVSSEHDISLESGQSVVSALLARGHQVEPLVIEKNGTFTFRHQTQSPLETTQELVRSQVEAIFLTLHGVGGEDGYIQAWFAWAGIPYTGSDLPASALAINKCTFKAVLLDRGLPTPRHVNISSQDWLRDHESALKNGEEGPGYPAILKVASAGSSYGVVKVVDRAEARKKLDELFRQDRWVIWESCVKGRELTVPVYADRQGVLQTLPVVEIVPQIGEFFDLASKYEKGGASEIVPADIDPVLAAQVCDLAKKTHTLAGCQGLSRTDFMVGDEGPMILEINTAPGLTPASLVPKSLAAAGLDFGAFFEGLIEEAMSRVSILGNHGHVASD